MFCRDSAAESKTREFRVTRTFWRQLALVQKEFPGAHRTKVWLGQGGQLFLEFSETRVGPVSLHPRGGAGPASPAGQRQMGRKRTCFAGHAEFRQPGIH